MVPRKGNDDIFKRQLAIVCLPTWLWWDLGHSMPILSNTSHVETIRELEAVAWLCSQVLTETIEPRAYPVKEADIKIKTPILHRIINQYHDNYRIWRGNGKDKRVDKRSNLFLKNNKGRFCNNSEIDTLISKGLYVKNKAKLSELEIVNKQYCGGGVWVCSWESFALFSTDNRFDNVV